MKQLLRLLQLLQSKRKLSVLQSPKGASLTEEEAIVGELCRYWAGVMTPTQATDQERRDYLSDMLERWRGVSERSWKEPNLDMVALALRDLDPASAAGYDGFTRAFYKAFSSPFSAALLDIIREVRETGVLPASWCEGMTRCVPKEQGCIAVLKQRPITLLTCKIKWLTGLLKLALNDLLSFVVPK